MNYMLLDGKETNSSATTINMGSSISNTIFRLILESSLNAERTIQNGQLNRVDLAEPNDRVQAGVNVQNSLLSLGRNISQMDDQPKPDSFVHCVNSNRLRILAATLSAIVCNGNDYILTLKFDTNVDFKRQTSALPFGRPLQETVGTLQNAQHHHRIAKPAWPQLRLQTNGFDNNLSQMAIVKALSNGVVHKTLAYSAQQLEQHRSTEQQDAELTEQVSSSGTTVDSRLQTLQCQLENEFRYFNQAPLENEDILAAVHRRAKQSWESVLLELELKCTDLADTSAAVQRTLKSQMAVQSHALDDRAWQTDRSALEPNSAQTELETMQADHRQLQSDYAVLSLRLKDAVQDNADLEIMRVEHAQLTSALHEANVCALAQTQQQCTVITEQLRDVEAENARLEQKGREVQIERDENRQLLEQSIAQQLEVDEMCCAQLQELCDMAGDRQHELESALRRSAVAEAALAALQVDYEADQLRRERAIVDAAELERLRCRQLYLGDELLASHKERKNTAYELIASRAELRKAQRNCASLGEQLAESRRGANDLQRQLDASKAEKNKLKAMVENDRSVIEHAERECRLMRTMRVMVDSELMQTESDAFRLENDISSADQSKCLQVHCQELNAHGKFLAELNEVKQSLHDRTRECLQLRLQLQTAVSDRTDASRCNHTDIELRIIEMETDLQGQNIEVKACQQQNDTLLSRNQDLTTELKDLRARFERDRKSSRRTVHDVLRTSFNSKQTFQNDFSKDHLKEMNTVLNDLRTRLDHDRKSRRIRAHDRTRTTLNSKQSFHKHEFAKDRLKDII